LVAPTQRPRGHPETGLDTAVCTPGEASQKLDELFLNREGLAVDL
jgi:hypothetical protein